MREIKFRGKRKDNNKWIYGSLLVDSYNCYYIVNNHEGFRTCDEVISETVGEYTGVKDKNGKEIYEGNIVSAFNGEIKAKIIYGLCGFEFEWITKRVATIRNRKSEPMFMNTSIIFEVIGNIYENPELIS